MQERGKESLLTTEERLIKLPAVVAKDPYVDYENMWVRENYHGQEDYEVPSPPSPIPRGAGRILNIRVDLSYPQDVLEAEIKAALQRAMERRGDLRQRGVLPPRPQRLHVSKLDFYLQVFDRHEMGEPYRGIAHALNKPKSTIQYAHIEAKRLVGGPARRDARPRAMAQGFPKIHTFNPTRHLKKCLTCREAETFDQYCAQTKDYATYYLWSKPEPYYGPVVGREIEQPEVPDTFDDSDNPNDSSD